MALSHDDEIRRLTAELKAVGEAIAWVNHLVLNFKATYQANEKGVSRNLAKLEDFVNEFNSIPRNIIKEKSEANTKIRVFGAEAKKGDLSFDQKKEYLELSIARQKRIFVALVEKIDDKFKEKQAYWCTPWLLGGTKLPKEYILHLNQTTEKSNFARMLAVVSDMAHVHYPNFLNSPKQIEAASRVKGIKSLLGYEFKPPEDKSAAKKPAAGFFKGERKRVALPPPKKPSDWLLNRIRTEIRSTPDSNRLRDELEEALLRINVEEYGKQEANKLLEKEKKAISVEKNLAPEGRDEEMKQIETAVEIKMFQEFVKILEKYYISETAKLPHAEGEPFIEFLNRHPAEHHFARAILITLQDIYTHYSHLLGDDHIQKNVRGIKKPAEYGFVDNFPEFKAEGLKPRP